MNFTSFERCFQFAAALIACALLSIFSPARAEAFQQEAEPQETEPQETDTEEQEEESRGFLGVTLDSGAEGAVILTVLEETAAEDIGLEQGDLILTFAGEEIDSYESLVEVIRQHNAGDKMEIEVERDGETFVEEVELGSAPENDEVFAMPNLGVAAFGLGAGAPKKNFLQAVKKLDLILQLQIRVDEMKLVCGIDDAQVRKLNVAAKAVAQRQVGKWTEQMEQFQMWNNTEEDGDDDEVIRVEDIDLKKIDANVLQWVSQDFGGEAGSRLTSNRIWKKAIKATLNDEQRKDLADFRKARKDRMLDACAELISINFGNRLSLSEEQLDRFTELLRKKLGSSNQPTFNSINNFYGSIQIIASLERKDLSELLNDKQLKRLRIILGAYGNVGMWQEDLEIDEDE